MKKLRFIDICLVYYQTFFERSWERNRYLYLPKRLGHIYSKSEWARERKSKREWIRNCVTVMKRSRYQSITFFLYGLLFFSKNSILSQNVSDGYLRSMQAILNIFIVQRKILYQNCSIIVYYSSKNIYIYICTYSLCIWPTPF